MSTGQKKNENTGGLARGAASHLLVLFLGQTTRQPPKLRVFLLIRHITLSYLTLAQRGWADRGVLWAQRRTTDVTDLIGPPPPRATKKTTKTARLRGPPIVQATV